MFKCLIEMTSISLFFRKIIPAFFLTSIAESDLSYDKISSKKSITSHWWFYFTHVAERCLFVNISAHCDHASFSVVTPVLLYANLFSCKKLAEQTLLWTFSFRRKWLDLCCYHLNQFELMWFKFDCLSDFFMFLFPGWTYFLHFHCSWHTFSSHLDPHNMGYYLTKFFIW